MIKYFLTEQRTYYIAIGNDMSLICPIWHAHMWFCWGSCTGNIFKCLQIQSFCRHRFSEMEAIGFLILRFIANWQELTQTGVPTIWYYQLEVCMVMNRIYICSVLIPNDERMLQKEKDIHNQRRCIKWLLNEQMKTRLHKGGSKFVQIWRLETKLENYIFQLFWMYVKCNKWNVIKRKTPFNWWDYRFGHC